eukprot:gene1452-1889_t
MLPRRVRNPASVLYGFCRLADDAVDVDGGRMEATARLRERVLRAYSGTPLPVPADRALAEVARRHGIPRQLFEALIDGLEWDAQGRRYETLAELQDYAARVAGTVGAMMASAATAYGPMGEVAAIPFGILCGLLIGLLNGVAVAYLRIPSMIITLAVNAVAQGLMVAYSGGFSPQDSASSAMKFIGAQSTLGIPHAVIVWIVVGAFAVFLLTRTTFGRAVYGIGNKESAAYLSGVP